LNALLDISKLDAGAVSRAQGRSRPKNYLASSMPNFPPLAMKKNLRFKFYYRQEG